MQLRAKSVLLRDLEELRAKRYALENPVPIVEEVEPIPEPEPAENRELDMEEDTAGFTNIKEERIQSTSPEKHDQPQPIEEPTKEDIAKATADYKEEQGPTPPPSNEKESKPIGLGINTDGAADSPAADTADVQNSAIDSLFDIPENENAGDSDLNFENMDFSIHDSNQGPSQAEAQEFDLSTFGSNTQDFNMADAQPDSNTANNTNNENKVIDDIFAMDNAGENMDLDLDLGMAGAEQSLFDDMYFDDDAGMGGGGGEEMEHGDFDAIFLGMDN